ncbi:hypothetical protein [Evansella cellulosilytica]|uniref:Uncharacterized protein n=1 Tax=Evansella cellulosilytica (strain ATCC 21833 / DSM 2522 / FERM P-1141 / JCM 9156 / N-4) TaxID=649639 RepID=E6TUC2_EVAC2|nr:hypothetical protein [Evansella cellulosilytica]ADU29678.1 hypothetical protein Bcell_1415 [Evansella cellulosilytica DSM 2522]
MKYILLEVGWKKVNKNQNLAFRELTEIVAVEVQIIDDIFIKGSKYHSYIRPVYQHWKKKKGVQHYSNWWLAPTFNDVMKTFQNWYSAYKNYPWVVSNRKVISILDENINKHDCHFYWPKEIVYVNDIYNHMEKDIIAHKKQKEHSGGHQSHCEEKVNQLILSFMKLRKEFIVSKPFVSPAPKKRRQQLAIVKQLKTLIEEQKVSVEEIAEWSQLSGRDINCILKQEKRINYIEEKKLTHAFHTYREVNALTESWGD